MQRPQRIQVGVQCLTVSDANVNTPGEGQGQVRGGLLL